MNDNQVLVGGLQPNMLLAAGLGAKFRFPPNLDADVEGQPLKGLKKKNDLPDFETLISHPFFSKIIDQIDHVKTNYPDYEIIPPFFWDASGRATIHGIFDPNPGSITKAKESFAPFAPGQELVVYDSLEAACMDPAVDGLIISTPNYTHLEVLKVAAKSGKHIFLEKVT